MRLMEAVDNRIRDLIGGGVARRQHVEAVRAAAQGDRRIVESLVTRLITQRMFYPRVCHADLVREVTRGPGV